MYNEFNKVKLSLPTSWRRTEGVAVQFRLFLTLAQCPGKRHAPTSLRLRKELRYPWNRRLSGPRTLSRYFGAAELYLIVLMQRGYMNVARMGNMRNAHEIIIGNPAEKTQIERRSSR